MDLAKAPPMRHTALAALACAALLVPGCGGSSKTSSSGSLHAQCSSALVAAAEYNQAAKEFGLNLKKKLLVAAVLSTTATLRGDVEALAKNAQGTARTQLEAFAAALTRETTLVSDLYANNLKEVAALSKGLNKEIPEGLEHLNRICAKA
jgi:hypothetical protein